MSDLNTPAVIALFDAPNYAVVSTQNGDGSILSTVVWVDLLDGEPAVNSAVGRRWPTNLERDPHVTLIVYDPGNPHEFAEVRGIANATFDGAEEHIDRLAKKYINEDRYPFREPDERRITFVIEPERVRYVKQ